MNARLLFLGIAAALLSGVSAEAQGFSANFSTTQGWTGNAAPATSGSNAILGWTTNDPIIGNEGQEVGETNFVRYVTGFTPGAVATSNSLLLGGLYQRNNYFAGVPAPEIVRPFSPFGSLGAGQFVRMQTDFGIVGSSGAFINRDRFTFDLRSTTGASMAKLSFGPTPLVAGAPPIQTGYNLRIDWISGTTVQTTANPALIGYYDAAYNQRYRLQVDFSQSSFTARVLTLNATQAVIATATVVQNGAFAGGLQMNDFGQFAAVWEISNTLRNNAAYPLGYNNAGSNYLILNNVSVVPEPATLTLLALSATIAVLVAMKRKRQSDVFEKEALIQEREEFSQAPKIGVSPNDNLLRFRYFRATQRENHLPKTKQ